MIHTRQANLSLLMRHVNGVFTQRFNQRHRKLGHLFQRRFKAVRVDRCQPDVGGQECGLVARPPALADVPSYKLQIVYVKFVGTHKAYDAVDAETIESA